MTVVWLVILCAFSYAVLLRCWFGCGVLVMGCLVCWLWLFGYYGFTAVLGWLSFFDCGLLGSVTFNCDLGLLCRVVYFLWDWLVV